MTTKHRAINRPTDRDPKTGRFRKGKSGNTKGRSAGAKGKKAILEKILNETKIINDNVGSHEITILELFLLKVKAQAANGDHRDIALFEEILGAVQPEMPQGSGFLIAPEPVESIEEWVRQARKVKAAMPKPEEDLEVDIYQN